MTKPNLEIGMHVKTRDGNYHVLVSYDVGKKFPWKCGCGKHSWLESGRAMGDDPSMDHVQDIIATYEKVPYAADVHFGAGVHGLTKMGLVENLIERRDDAMRCWLESSLDTDHTMTWSMSGRLTKPKHSSVSDSFTITHILKPLWASGESSVKPGPYELTDDAVVKAVVGDKKPRIVDDEDQTPAKEVTLKFSADMREFMASIQAASTQIAKLSEAITKLNRLTKIDLNMLYATSAEIRDDVDVEALLKNHGWASFSPEQIRELKKERAEDIKTFTNQHIGTPYMPAGEKLKNHGWGWSSGNDVDVLDLRDKAQTPQQETLSATIGSVDLKQDVDGKWYLLVMMLDESATAPNFAFYNVRLDLKSMASPTSKPTRKAVLGKKKQSFRVYIDEGLYPVCLNISVVNKRGISGMNHSWPLNNTLLKMTKHEVDPGFFQPTRSGPANTIAEHTPNGKGIKLNWAAIPDSIKTKVYRVPPMSELKLPDSVTRMIRRIVRDRGHTSDFTPLRFDAEGLVFSINGEKPSQLYRVKLESSIDEVEWTPHYLPVPKSEMKKVIWPKDEDDNTTAHHSV